MDLTKTTSLGGKCYGFIIVDDFSRFTWYLTNKDEAIPKLSKFSEKLKKENESL